MSSRRALPLLAARLFGAPLAILEPKLAAIVQGIGPRLLAGEDWGEPARNDRERRPYAVDSNGIAVLPIDGILLQKGGWCDAQSEYLTGYDQLGWLLGRAIEDPGVKAILLDVNSPGGEVAGCKALADRLLQARSVKPIWAVANECAASAAYWLASAADELWVPETGYAGSIGIIAVHLDRSAEEKAAGLKYTAIFSGARKNDGTPHEPLSRQARDSLQAECDRIRGLFATSVAKGRGLSVEAVLATEAGFFPAPEALERRLADRIGTLDQARAALAARLAQAGARPAGLAASQPGAGTTHMTTAAAPAPDRGAGDPGAAAEQNPANTPVATQPQATLDAARQAGRSEAMAYANEVTRLCAAARRPGKISGYLDAQTPIATVQAELLAELAAETDANPVRTQRAPGGSAGEPGNNFGWDAIARKAGAHRFAQATR